MVGAAVINEHEKRVKRKPFGKCDAPEGEVGPPSHQMELKLVPKRIKKTAPPQTRRISGCIKRDMDRCSGNEDICL